MALRRAAHKTLNSVSQNIEGLRYNVAVAQIYELTHALSAALDKSAEGIDWAIREAAELLVQMIGPMLPHLAEECWAAARIQHLARRSALAAGGGGACSLTIRLPLPYR